MTNVTLREVVPVESEDARRLLQDLVARGRLRRRGQTRGTYYVLPSEDVPDERDQSETDLASSPVRSSRRSALRGI